MFPTATDLQDQLTIDTKYLQNFWEPKVGDEVKTVSGDIYRLMRVLDPSQPQVLLEGADPIYYLQDLDWVPAPDRFVEVLEKQFKVKVYNDSVAVGKTWFKKPETVCEFADLIRQVRMLRAAFNH